MERGFWSKPSKGLWVLLVLLTTALGVQTGVVVMAQEEVLYVRDVGAIPDDGLDDAMAVRRAISLAKRRGYHTLVFEPGVYTLKYPLGSGMMLQLIGEENLTFRGAVDEVGKPATIFEINGTLKNDVTVTEGPGHIHIRGSKHITIENLVLDYNPRYGTAGQVVAVDVASDIVVVDILPGLPHFPGMKCYSANAWDLETRQLLPVNALSIGTSGPQFARTWQPVPGYPARYMMQGMGFSDRVQVGDGISWHFNVRDANNNVRILESEDVVLRNVHIYNSIAMSILAVNNKDLTFENVQITPQGNSLAVAPRDGFHLAFNTGRLLMDGVFVKGVRWDPINMKSGFGEIREIIDQQTVRYSLRRSEVHLLAPGTRVVFWVGEIPQEREVAHCILVDQQALLYELLLTEPMPAGVQLGSLFTPLSWVFSEGVIRNCTFESNFGTGIVVQNENMRIENNIFRYNAYDNIGLGPTGPLEGGYARNITIRNNVFEHSTWLNKYHVHEGAISAYYSYQPIAGLPGNVKYNTGIVIEHNVFRDLTLGETVTAISLRNAQDVILRNNQFFNVREELKLDTQTTKNITLE